MDASDPPIQSDVIKSEVFSRNQNDKSLFDISTIILVDSDEARRCDLRSIMILNQRKITIRDWITVKSILWSSFMEINWCANEEVLNLDIFGYDCCLLIFWKFTQIKLFD